MGQMTLRYVVVYSARKPAAVEAARRIEDSIRVRGLIADVMEVDAVLSEGIPADAGMLIVLGGDGTLLRSVSVLPRPIPVLTINYGRGGYLMEVEPERLGEAVEAVLEGRYEVEKAMMLSFEVDGRKLADALNEAYISATVPGKIIEFTVKRGGTELYHAVADALIISTPMGSTAYAYSAGGPAVDDYLDSAVLVPVCPITNTRAVVLSLRERFTVIVESKVGVQVLIDGYFQERFDGPVELRVRRSENHVSFVRLRCGESFARRLRKRFR